MEPPVSIHVRRRSTPIFFSSRPSPTAVSPLSSTISSISEAPSIATTSTTATTASTNSTSSPILSLGPPRSRPRPISDNSVYSRRDSGLSFNVTATKTATTINSTSTPATAVSSKVAAVSKQQQHHHQSDSTPPSPRYIESKTLGNRVRSLNNIRALKLQCQNQQQASPSAGQAEIIDLLNPDTIRQTFEDDAIMARWLAFARSRDCAQNIEYMLRIRKYIRDVHSLQDSITSISSTFTSLSAPSPITLPPAMLRAVSSDARQVSNTYIPRLETLFLESQFYLEQNAIPDIYYAFIRNQLAMSISAHLSLSVPCEASPFSSLGESFCLSDARAPGYPITHVSDGYTNLSGYSRSEIIQHNKRRLDGPATNPDTLKRIQTALKRGEESVELLVNYRNDGTPFWNLMYLCPLTDALTHDVRYYLAAQVDVTEGISSTDDVLGTLTFGSQKTEPKKPTTTPQKTHRISRMYSLRSTPTSATPQTLDKEAVSSPLSRRRMFPSFRKQHPYQPRQKQSQEQQQTPQTPIESAPETPAAQPKPSLQAVDALLHTPQDVAALCPTDDINAFYTPYTRFLILSVVQPPKTHHPHPWTPLDSPSPSLSRKKHATVSQPALAVSFCSKPAQEALGLGHPRDVLGHDVFDILANAHCSSLTKSSKAAVHDRVLHDGNSLIIDIVLPAMNRGGGSCPDLPGFRMKKSHKFLGHWTPLKDADGLVCWIMLTLSPVVRAPPSTFL
ncbi:hypothetical protein Cpir12675_001152 [Ceratocystis pirilliformis]|uniref:PAS domain-containing protein n=1 Tax=Ceratocystis pirilliformis TaxID=259994 RepID=A0ABR3ZHA9_9PEZI